MMSCCVSRSRKNHALSFSFLYLGARRPSPLNPVSLPSVHIKRHKVTTAGSSQDLSTWSRPGEAEIRPPGSVFNVDSGVFFFFYISRSSLYTTDKPFPTRPLKSLCRFELQLFLYVCFKPPFLAFRVSKGEIGPRRPGKWRRPLLQRQLTQQCISKSALPINLPQLSIDVKKQSEIVIAVVRGTLPLKPATYPKHCYTTIDPKIPVVVVFLLFLFFFFALYTEYKVDRLTSDCSFPNAVEDKLPDPHCPPWSMLSHVSSLRRWSRNSFSKKRQKTKRFLNKT